tara:strand:- start:3228 stop:5894 length:2667 start_codon:yes stop_codon:yes gene_type:complete
MTVKATANKNQYSKRVRRAEQCWLLANLNDIVDDNPEQEITRTYKHSFNTHHITLGEKNSVESMLGKYFIGSDIFALFDLSTEQIAALVPKIRLFRVDLEKSGKLKKGAIKEFFFPQHAEKSQVEDMIMGKHDRFGEVGIQSVNIELQGGQPVDAKRYLQVKLDLYFSTLAAMNQVPYSSGKGNDVSYFDLFRRIGNNSYRLRMDVGWSVPPETMYLFDDDEGRAIIKALQKSNKTLWLHMKDHALDFEQTGAVKVSIDYISSLEYDMQNFSIIKDTTSANSDSKDNKQKKSKLRKILVEFESSKCKLKKDSAKHKAYNSARKKMKEQMKKFDIQKNLAGLRVLREINANLEKIVSPSEIFPRTRTFSVAIDPLELGYVDGTFDGEIDFSNRKRKIANVQSYKHFKTNKKNRTVSVEPYFSQIELASQFKTSSPTDKRKYKKYIDALYKQLTTKIDGKDAAVFKFCFLGDIFDAIMDANLTLYGRKNEYFNSMLRSMRVVFGHVNLPTLDKDGTPITRRINLSDLPISYNLFNAWFIRNVVDKGRVSFPYKDFFRKMITELVTAALGSSCMAKQDTFFKRYSKPRPELTFSTVRVSKKGKEIFTQKSATIPLGEMVNDKQVHLAKPKSAEANMFLKRMTGKKIRNVRFKEADNLSSDVNMLNYVFINTRNYVYTRKKNFVKDLKEGIFHFRIGQDSGLVKSINFEKTDSKFLESALLTDRRNKTDLDQIRRIYNAKIELYGNATFIPGQMVYIDPTAIGFGSPDNATALARQIGLGGYFVVVAVSHSLSRGDYTTNITCRWVSFGDGRKAPKGVKKVDDITVKGKCNDEARNRLLKLWNQNCDDDYKIADELTEDKQPTNSTPTSFKDDRGSRIIKPLNKAPALQPVK